jgi:hypothetical protein
MRIAAWLVVAGAVAWSVALVLGPLLRPDLDPLTTHPETYAQGAWALLMRVGYVAIAIAGAAAAFVARRYRVAAALLAVFAAGALAIGLLPPTGEGTLADTVFGYAQLAPLAFLPAIAWLSWRERRPALLVLAVLAWLLFLPLVFGEPPFGGLLNRVADLVMAAWLTTFARPYQDVQRGPDAGAPGS